MNTITGPGGAVRLTHWGVVTAQGADAAAFLQGQLSNDVQKLDARHARLAAYCSAQGRMQASFIVGRHAPDEFWLACSADVLQATVKRLSMFVLRSKVRLADASASLAVLGLAGEAAVQWLAEDAGVSDWDACAREGGLCIRLPRAEGSPRWLWMGPVERAQAVLEALPALDEAQWRWLEVRSGVGHIVAATVNQFVPQMLNYELLGGVDFKKGCYPGQEVVARSQYLGKLKRRSFLAEGPADLQAGQEVYWSADPAQPAGTVALAARDPAGGASAIVELKLQATGSGELHLGSADGPPLRLVPLPYTLPHESGSTTA